jgi:hypothetical protein
MIGLSSVAGMGIIDRVVKRALRLGADVAETATGHAERAGFGFQASRTIFADEAQPTPTTTLGGSLIVAHRPDR